MRAELEIIPPGGRAVNWLNCNLALLLQYYTTSSSRHQVYVDWTYLQSFVVWSCHSFTRLHIQFVPLVLP